LSDLFGINFGTGEPAPEKIAGASPEPVAPSPGRSRRTQAKKTAPAESKPDAAEKGTPSRRGRPPKATATPGETTATKTRRRHAPGASSVQPPAGNAKIGRSRSQTSVKKPAAAKRKPRATDPVDQILKIILASRRGIDVPTIQKRTGIDPVKIRNTIFAALRKGLIQRLSRGVYKGV
jgi:hypothetical protein